MPRLGQHFLNDRATLSLVVETLALRKGDTLFEIGPGHGELTFLLAEDSGAGAPFVTAIEKDGALAAQLKSEIATRGLHNIELVSGDALSFLKSFKPPAGEYKLTGNIPYYITGHLLRVVGELEHGPVRTVLIVQKEVAERVSAEPPRMNRLAASVRFWAEPSLVAVVPRGRFSPPPKVDSAILLLEKKSGAPSVASEKYYSAVRAIFSQPRKTLLNNLLPFFNKRLSKKEIADLLARLHIDENARPQDLSVEKIAAISSLAP